MINELKHCLIEITKAIDKDNLQTSFYLALVLWWVALTRTYKR